MRDLERMGIPFHRPSAWLVNTRARRRWGQCRKFPDGHYEINISERLLESPEQKDALRTTILHELLHTCYGCMNHGKRWKMYAEKVNAALGCTIRATESSKEMGLPEETGRAVYKHKFVCRTCGAVVYRQRESRFTKNYQYYRCARCGGTFHREY